MAYRRRQQVVVRETFFIRPHDPPSSFLDGDDLSGVASSPSASSIAAKAIRASSAHRDSSLSSAYGHPTVSSPRGSVSSPPPSHSFSNSTSSMKTSNEPKQGFWGVLAQKAKSILDDDNAMGQHEEPDKTGFRMSSKGKGGQYEGKYQTTERRPKTESSTLPRGLGAIASSLDYIGGRIGNALEEGLTVVENRTADIIQETRKLQIKLKENKSALRNETLNSGSSTKLSMAHSNVPQMQSDLEIQLKASRDVAMAMAAKAKLLLRELKTVKADLAFAKERCAQLEEENKFLRESREKGDSPEDDDLIRLQLESLLAEKARLAQENSVFARENRFLREIVEYHQLTMQDVVYLDESSEDLTEVYPVGVPSAANLQALGTSAYSFPMSSASPPSSNGKDAQLTKDGSFHALGSLDPEGTDSFIPLSSYIHLPEENLERH